MSDTTPAENLTLASLEEASGLSARTIRYYISQGLVPGPLTVGRNASYGPQHLALLQRIAAAKKEGLSLEEIRQQLYPTQGVQPGLPPFQTWQVVQPADDVAVFVREGTSPWRRNQIDKALVSFVTAVARTRSDSEEG